MDKISVIIPCYNEEATIGRVVEVAKGMPGVGEVLVVDDGSTDKTAFLAAAAGGRVLQLPVNQGKGRAMAAGIREARYPYVLFIDGDLETTSEELTKLVAPVLTGAADVTVGCPVESFGGGFGLVVRLARFATRFGAVPLRFPLSGQRAGRRDLLLRIDFGQGYGVETSMNFQLARLGARVQEVDLHFRHHFTGRDLAGFRHRGRQFCHVLRAICKEVWRGK